jgi:hypothetical protein
MSTMPNFTNSGSTHPASANPACDPVKRPRRPATSTLHARVYTLLIAFSAWFALAVWSFAGGGLSDYLLVIVGGFIFVVVVLQLILSRVGRPREPELVTAIRHHCTIGLRGISKPGRIG